jgi:hypothetical protein
MHHRIASKDESLVRVFEVVANADLGLLATQRNFPHSSETRRESSDGRED